jgi:arginyl-tRNA synthetase
VYQLIANRFRKALAGHIRRKYKIELGILSEQPPRLEMGEVATPVCFELAKQLKKAPRILAQEIATTIGPIEGIARIEVAGGGYLNAYLDRAAYLHALAKDSGNEARTAAPDAPKTIVEHTSINPNKAAHIGHLRNAVLGDTFSRILRYSGERVEVQNYIDNTGVQVADVVLGFMHIEKKSLDEVKSLAAKPKFDFYCWDLYARVTVYLEENKDRLKLRGETLKKIEDGRSIEAEMGEVISTAIVRRHLETTDRLGIDYDLLARESEILHLKFWDAAFELLKARGGIHFVSSGKNAGCWVMHTGEGPGAPDGSAPAASESGDTADDDAKIIVRSNGTVTYVGKDIAYHLWKFGLLGRDFHYRPFYKHPDGLETWVTAQSGGSKAPAFGHAARVYNVIDTRQAYPQRVVVLGLRAAGFEEQADHLSHLAYDVVALTPRCARELGYEIAPEDAKKPYVDISGRKGQGVKADDLLDKLLAATRAEVNQRHPETPEKHRETNARKIAIGALRYFLLKYTRTTIIAFDFEDALSFEGETGPYCLYAIVRARSIWRKGAERSAAGASASASPASNEFPRDAKKLTEAAGDTTRFLAETDIWEVVLRAGLLGTAVESAIAAEEPAFIAKWAFQLAQSFNVFYHKHHILTEEDAQKKAFLLLLTLVVENQLVGALRLLGIEAPDEM